MSVSQLFRCSLFYDRSFVEIEDAIGGSDLVEPVRDQECGPPHREALKSNITSRSFWLSRPVVGSSSIKIGVFRIAARASARRCLWPTDSVTPRSPNTVS